MSEGQEERNRLDAFGQNKIEVPLPSIPTLLLNEVLTPFYIFQMFRYLAFVCVLMCVHVYVCICVYMCVYVCICVYMCVYVCICADVHCACLRECVCGCVWMCVDVWWKGIKDDMKCDVVDCGSISYLCICDLHNFILLCSLGTL